MELVLWGVVRRTVSLDSQIFDELKWVLFETLLGRIVKIRTTVGDVVPLMVGGINEFHFDILTFSPNSLRYWAIRIAITIFGEIVITCLNFSTKAVSILDVCTAWAVFFFWEVITTSPTSILCIVLMKIYSLENGANMKDFVYDIYLECD